MSTPRSARPRACFVAVYVTGTAAGARLLRGGSRAAALVALGVVLGLVAFSRPVRGGALRDRRRRAARSAPEAGERAVALGAGDAASAPSCPTSVAIVGYAWMSAPTSASLSSWAIARASSWMTSPPAGRGRARRRSVARW
jgi:hypothetical protein